MIKITIPVNVETDERTFEHGEITIQRANQWELSIDVDVQLVVGIGQDEAFHNELQELIKKYAI